MRLSLSLTATACLLAISSATTINISGNTQEQYKSYDSSCHNVGTWDSSRLQVMIIGTPVNFYHGSNCNNGFKTVYDRGGQWQFIESPIRSRKSKPFHPRRDLQFSGSADTDGVSISLKFSTTAVKEKRLKSAAKGAATRKAANAVAKMAAGATGGVVATGRGSTHAAVVAVDVDSPDSDKDGGHVDGVAAADDGAVGNFVACSGSVPTDVETEFTAIAADVAADIGTGGAAATRVICAARGAKKKQPKKESNADCLYVHQLPRKYLAENRSRMVYDDMGRGDIHSFMHHLSTRRRRRVMRYSRKQRGKETRMWRFRKIHEKVKKSFPIDAISKAESWLAKFDHASLDPAKYKAYVEARAVVWPLLSG
ncbi:hypothetical protein GGI16_008067, partial [Coemansia sp. S142-1]